MGCSVLIPGLYKGKTQYRKVCGQTGSEGQKDTSHRGEAVCELPYPGPHYCLTLAAGGQDIYHLLQRKLHMKTM